MGDDHSERPYDGMRAARPSELRGHGRDLSEYAVKTPQKFVGPLVSLSHDVLKQLEVTFVLVDNLENRLGPVLCVASDVKEAGGRGASYDDGQSQQFIALTVMHAHVMNLQRRIEELTTRLQV